MRYLPGRPSYWADISWEKSMAQPVINKFYAAIRELTTREITALAHGLYCSRAAIWRWQHGQTAPDYERMAQVIAWVEAGKPMIKTQHERYTMRSKPPIPKPRKPRVVRG